MKKKAQSPLRPIDFVSDPLMIYWAFALALVRDVQW